MDVDIGGKPAAARGDGETLPAVPRSPILRRERGRFRARFRTPVDHREEWCNESRLRRRPRVEKCRDVSAAAVIPLIHSPNHCLHLSF